MSDWEALRTGVSARVMGALEKHLDLTLLTPEGREDVYAVVEMLTECALVEASGGDARVAKMALTAALGNWEVAGRIRVAGMRASFLKELRAGLVEAASVGLTLLGAGLRGVVLGR